MSSPSSTGTRSTAARKRKSATELEMVEEESVEDSQQTFQPASEMAAPARDPTDNVLLTSPSEVPELVEEVGVQGEVVGKVMQAGRAADDVHRIMHASPPDSFPLSEEDSQDTVQHASEMVAPARDPTDNLQITSPSEVPELVEEVGVQEDVVGE